MSVNPLKLKPLSDVKNLKLNYIDKSLDYVKTDFSLAEGFTFSNYEAFENFNDITINGYSYFFLGKKDLFSNWIQYNKKENKISSYLVPIKFTLDTKPCYLYFESGNIEATYNKINEYDTDARLHYAEDLAQKGVDENSISSNSNYIFIIEFIENTNTCYIKHNDDAQVYYLYNRKYIELANPEVSPDGEIGPRMINPDDIHFTTNKELAEQFGLWHYILTDNDILFYQVEYDLNQLDNGTWYHTKYNIKDGELVNYPLEPEHTYYFISQDVIDHYRGITINDSVIENKVRIRTFKPYPESSEYGKLYLTDNRELLPSFDENGTIYVSLASIGKHLLDVNVIDTEKYINTSWISYKNLVSGEVNKSKSDYNMESQCIFHLQYNNIDDTDYSTTLNIIPLKNHISPMNNAIRGDYMNNTDVNLPNVDFREYTTLETGHEQELGNETVSLNYVYYTDEFTINPGEDLSFSIKFNDESLNNCLKPILYPFNHININDTNFAKNGAFGSTIPFLADKVKKLQKDSKFVNNGRYLYTWLYQSESKPYGVWFDRYYYPNLISKKAAERGENINGTTIVEPLPSNVNPASYQDIIDKDYIGSNQNMYLQIKDTSYFDKQSDLVIEPGTQYVYSRLGKDNIDEIITEINEFKLSDFTTFDSDSNITVQTIPNAKFKDSGELDINFKMYINPNKTYGYNILSNSNTNGLSVTNEKDISPFIYTFDNAKEKEDSDVTTAYVRLHNHNFEEVKEINLSELYANKDKPVNEVITDLYIPRIFDDLLVITGVKKDEPQALEDGEDEGEDDNPSQEDDIIEVDENLTPYAFYILSYDLFIKERFLFKNIFDADPNITGWKLLKSYIRDNKVYFLFDCFYGEERDEFEPYLNRMHKVLSFDLKAQPLRDENSNDITNIVLPSEICRYNTISKLVFKKPENLWDENAINEASKKLYPAYYSGDTASDSTEFTGNLEKAYVKDGFQVYKIKRNLKYSIPYGLNEGDEVIIKDENPNFDLNYWYYAPIFQNTDLQSKYGDNLDNSVHINSLYINNDNELFGLPFYIISHAQESNHLYGVRERIENSLYSVEDADLIKYKTMFEDNGTLDIIFSSYTKIYDLTMDNLGRMGILKNESKDPGNLGSMQLKIFGSNKQLQQTYTFDSEKYSELSALDSLKIYNDGIKNNYITLLAKYKDPETLEVSQRFIFISENYSLNYLTLPKFISPILDKTVNYSKNIQNNLGNTLDFSLHLQTKNLLIDHYTYSLDLDELISAWHDFRIIINLNSGIFSVYIDGELLDRHNQIKIPRYTYNYKNTLNYPLLFGPLTYRNGQTLAKFLNLDANTFNSINVRMKECSVYSQILNYYQYQANKLQYIGLDPLTITLPAGQRNNIEEIIRYFKYIPPGNVSNTIQINIKNSGIVKESDQQALALQILNSLNDNLALPITIKEINFI